MSTTAGVPISGHCDPRFAGVRDAFAQNFAQHGERGAAVCLSVEGRVVVDLAGGWRDEGRAWESDTLVNVFSIGKAMLSLSAVKYSVVAVWLVGTTPRFTLPRILMPRRASSSLMVSPA